MQTHRKYLRHTTTSMATDSKLGPQILAAFAGICFKHILLEAVSIDIIISYIDIMQINIIDFILKI